MSWSPELNWQTPAGRTLQLLFAELPSTKVWHLTLFGSSPLQMAIEPSFTSADVDLFPDDAHDEIQAAIARAGLEKDEHKVYVQCCWEGNFRTSPRWARRAFTTQIGHINLTLPHPIDILIAKLHRLEEKT